MIQAGFGQQVAGQMLADQVVVGNVGIQRPDQVVAVAPRLGHIRVALAPVRFGVSHEIHPVTRPALAEMRRAKQTIDNVFHRPRRIIRYERLDLALRRGQSGQGEREASQ